ncbi:MAG: hypothetical protein RL685_98, partial [Pseudomonadota bacterium]
SEAGAGHGSYHAWSALQREPQPRATVSATKAT